MTDTETIVTAWIEPTSAGAFLLKWRKESGVSAVGVWQEFATREAAEGWAEFLAEGQEIIWREEAA